MRPPTLGWMWASLGLTLIVGVCLGVIGDRLLLHEPETPQIRTRPVWFRCSDEKSRLEAHPDYPYHEKYRKVILARLSEELHLRPEQRGDLEALLESKRKGVFEFWVDAQSAYCGFQKQLRGEIHALLDPDQKAIYEEMLANMRANSQRGQGHKPNGEKPAYQP